MTETIRYSLIGKQDLALGKGSITVTLADGRVVTLSQVDVGAILDDSALSTKSLSGMTFTGTTTFSSLTANTVLYLNGSKELTSFSAMTNGQLIIGNTGSAPTLATLTASGLITITNAAGSVTISTSDQDVCGRLTLTSATPVTTADVTAATTVYFTPYQGNTLPLYDGTDWLATEFSETSQTTSDTTKSPAAVAADSNYDMFLWNDSGTVRCTRGPAWSSATARGTGAGTTELELFEGRYVNKVAITNGPAARRGVYVGTIRSTSASQIEDSLVKRYLWNYYHRVDLGMVNAFTAGRATTSATYVELNSEIRVQFVRGVSEDAILFTAGGRATSSNNASIADISIGIDGTTAEECNAGGRVYTAGANMNLACALTKSNLSAGFHYATFLGRIAGGDTLTLEGTGTAGTRPTLTAMLRG